MLALQRRITPKHNEENCPNGIFANTAGRTINSNPGPSVGLTPNAKIAGKIANPASTVIKQLNLQ